MLPLELKRSESISFEKFLGPYIKKHYGDNPKNFSEDFKVIENARADCINGEVSLGAITNNYRYFEYLKKIQIKFPIDANNIKISFPWYNSFPSDHKLEYICIVTSYNLSFEKASIIYNIAVIYYKLARHEYPLQPNVACDHFIKSAGAFKLLLEEFSGFLDVPPNCDLNSAAISSLLKLTLAYGQECYILKAIQSGKDSLIIKLAASCGDLFDASFEALVNQPVTSSFGQSWISELQAKSLYYFALAQFKKSHEHLSAGKYGEQISRLTCASNLLQKAFLLQKLISPELLNDLKTLSVDVETILGSANRDNGLIYHDLVPKLESLPTLPRAEMVAPKAPLMEPISLISIFSGLIPLVIHVAMNTYKERKGKLVQLLCKELKTIEEDMDGKLLKMGLPGRLEAVEKSKGIPESILKKSTELRAMNAEKALEERIKELGTLSSQTQHILDEIKHLIGEEAKEDDEIRKRLKSSWNRPTSGELNEKYRNSLARYQTSLNEARVSDATVTKKYESVIPSIIHLCSSPEELEKIIPECSYLSPKPLNPTAEALRRLLNELETLKLKHKELVQKLKLLSENEDSTPEILQVPLNSNFETVFEESLKGFDELKNQIHEFVPTVHSVLEQIKNKNAEFLASSKTSPSAKEREAALELLEDGYKNHKALTVNLKEAIQFYNDIMKYLASLKTEVEDYCDSRRLEFKNMLVRLKPGMTNMDPDGQSILTVSSFGSDYDVHSKRPSDCPDIGSIPSVPFYIPPPSQGQPSSHYQQQQYQHSGYPHQQPFPTMGSYDQKMALHEDGTHPSSYSFPAWSYPFPTLAGQQQHPPTAWQPGMAVHYAPGGPSAPPQTQQQSLQRPPPLQQKPKDPHGPYY